MVKLHNWEDTTLFKKMLVLVLVSFLLFACGNKSKEELLNEGVQLTEKGNITGGIILFRNALEKDPNFFEARFQLAKNYILVERFDQAERELQKVKLQSPSNPEIDALLAKAYLETKRYDDALTKIENYLNIAPPTADVMVIKARALFEKRNFSQSMEAFRVANEIDQKNLDAYIGMASIYLHEERSDLALTLLERAVELHPSEKLPLMMVANIYMARGQHEEALGTWNRILDIDASDAQALYQAGLLKIEGGSYEEGFKLAEELVRRHPNRPQGYQLRGLVEYNKKEWNRAADDFQKSLTFGEILQSHYFWGLCQYHLGRYEMALSGFNRALDIRPDFTPARMMLASTLMTQGRIDEAVMQAQTAVAGDPGNAWAHNVLGSALIMQRRYEEGMAAFEVALQIDPTMGSVALKKGVVSVGLGDLAAAETAMVAAVSANPETLENHLVLAAFFLRSGQVDRAVTTLKEALSGGERDALLQYQLANIYFLKGQNDLAVSALEAAKKSKEDFTSAYQALAIYHLATGNPQKALVELDSILQRESNNFRVLYLKAGALDQMGKKGDALATLQKTVTVDQIQGTLVLAYYHLRNAQPDQALSAINHALADLPSEVALLELRGKIKMHTKAYSDAFKDFEKIIQVHPEKGIPLLAQAYVNAGQIDKAVALAQNVIDQQPEVPAGYLLLGAGYAQVGRFSEALDSLDRGILRVNDKLPLLLNKGDVLTRMGRTDEALLVFDKILATNSHSVSALYGKATLLLQKEDQKGAIEHYENILKVQPNHIPTLNNLAYIYVKNMKYKEGLEHAMRAFRASPNEPAIMDTLGYALYRNGRAEEARGLLEGAAQALPDNPTVLYHLALVYNDLSENDLAVKTLESSLAKGDFPEKKQARELLNNLNGAQ